jgi:tRNA U34 5-carboxymethylaminomethyl modifying GTPase MnmE/TrmE
MYRSLRSLYDSWRGELAHHLARVEAAIDFVEEEIDDAVVLAVRSTVTAHTNCMRIHSGYTGRYHSIGLATVRT